jgi:GNAT superfamily N-acetyltransferase
LNKSAKCYVITWNDKPIGFIAILPFVGVGDAKTRVISRIVVLPDYQGLGIGKQIINYFSSLYASVGSKMYIRTINPAIGIALSNDKNWKPTSKHLKEVTDGSQPSDTKKQKRLRRLSYSLKYEGEPSQDNTDLITFNADAWKEVAQNQISLF